MSHLYFCTARFPGAGRLPGFCGWPVDLHVAGRLAEFILAPITPLRYNYKMGIIEPFPGNITESEETL